MKCPHCQADNTSDSVFCHKCGAPLVSPDKASYSRTITFQQPVFGLPEGSIFAERYKIIKELGVGGMGKVYRVMDETIDEEIALKLIKPEIASDIRTIARFKNELKLSRKISHTNVCRMHHLGEDEGIPFITMELIHGADLKSFLQKEGALSLDKVYFYTKQICAGLSAAHKLGVIHRDLKPSNIMINEEGVAKIMDFGIARSISTETITESGMMVGTLDYMSPEQAGGQKVDNRSDIYTLGVILFHLVTGELPFKGDTPIGTALKHQTEPPPPPIELKPEIPEALNHIILKCLEKTPDKRYQDVEDLLIDLEKVETGETIKFKPETEKSQKKFRWPIFAVPIFIIALLAAIYFIFIRGPSIKSPDLKIAEKTSTPIQKVEAQEKPEETSVPPTEPKIKSDPQTKTVAPPPGILEITSTPAGTEIFVNNRREGTTPFTGDFNAGRYKIRLSKGLEYKDVSAALDITSGETQKKNYTLPPNYAVKVETDPPGASVKADGILKGQSPLQFDLSKNECQLTVEMDSLISINETKTLNQGLNTYQFTLQKMDFKMTINTNPSQANVFIDDLPLGVSPAEKTVPPGSHKIKIEKSGFQLFEETIDIQADFRKTYNLVAEEAPTTSSSSGTGKILIKVLPFADVFIDGVLIGEVPPSITQDVRAGKHTLEFVSTSLNKRHSVDVDVKSDESIEVRMNMNTGESQIVKLPTKK